MQSADIHGFQRFSRGSRECVHQSVLRYFTELVKMLASLGSRDFEVFWIQCGQTINYLDFLRAVKLDWLKTSVVIFPVLFFVSSSEGKSMCFLFHVNFNNSFLAHWAAKRSLLLLPSTPVKHPTQSGSPRNIAAVKCFPVAAPFLITSQVWLNKHCVEMKDRLVSDDVHSARTLGENVFFCSALKVIISLGRRLRTEKNPLPHVCPS